MLLDWYDAHGRVLPWRVKGGRGEAYRVWLSEVMLQQTTVATVKGYYARFLGRWPTVQALAAADDAAVMGEWAGLGYYARARNLLDCARIVAVRGFPEDEAGLRALPGVGPYTAAAIAAIAFDKVAVVVDGNVERVMARMFAIEAALPGAKGALVAAAGALTPNVRPGDYAQAVMDLGATVCTPRNPACGVCPWMGLCIGRARGIAGELPRKVAKAMKPTRQGVVWVALRADGAVLVERRVAKGLLGGTLGFPGCGWDGSEGVAPVQGDWREAGAVRHTFTHFHLDLTVMAGEFGLDAVALRGGFVGSNGFAPGDLPTLMRKAYDRAVAG